MKWSGMLVVSLSGINQGLWSRRVLEETQLAIKVTFRAYLKN